jgi:hypothetical protein
MISPRETSGANVSGHCPGAPPEVSRTAALRWWVESVLLNFYSERLLPVEAKLLKVESSYIDESISRTTAMM